MSSYIAEDYIAEKKKLESQIAKAQERIETGLANTNPDALPIGRQLDVREGVVLEKERLSEFESELEDLLEDMKGLTGGEE